MRMFRWLREHFSGAKVDRDLNDSDGAPAFKAFMHLMAAFEPIAFELLDEPYFQALRASVSEESRAPHPKVISSSTRTARAVTPIAHPVPNDILFWASLN